MEYVFPLIKAIISFLAFVLVHKLVWKMIRGQYGSKSSVDQATKQPPEPPGAWPVIGHLHLLGGQVPACRTLGALADQHGPIFAIRLGVRKALVVSSWDVVKECFTTHDQVFLTRPKSAASTHMGYGTAFLGFSPSGPYWREIRKIATLELLSNRQLDLLADVRASELQSCIKHLYSLCVTSADGSAKANMSWWFSCLTMNTMVRMISGKRYSCVEADGYDNVESRRLVRAIKELMYLSGVFVVSDFIPYVKWLDFQGYVRSMKSNAKELDKIMSKWLEEHLQNRRDHSCLKEDSDFMDAILSLFGDNIDASLYGYKNENVIKATTLNLITASVDTTFVTLTWALSLLLNHNQVLRIVQEELDRFVGRERWVEESDMKSLVYLQAIIKETLRLYPPGPLSVPREALEDCCLAGYHIPKGTILFVNIWKQHRDPRIWQEPEEFKPERFLTAHMDVDVRGQQFEYIPFSSGRRACPGISSAMRMLSLSLARVLQGFNIATPRNEPVDMSEGLGMTMPKTTPLEVILSPRLPNELYNNS